MTKEECEIETSKAIMEMRNHITDIKKEKEECEIETSKAIMEMRNHITDIKKENAELKELIENIIRVYLG